MLEASRISQNTGDTRNLCTGNKIRVQAHATVAAMRGIFAPVLTPFLPSGAPDITRFLWHARWLLSNDVNLAIFGTNSGETKHNQRIEKQGGQCCLTVLGRIICLMLTFVFACPLTSYAPSLPNSLQPAEANSMTTSEKLTLLHTLVEGSCNITFFVLFSAPSSS
jgi:hypothetical protein